MNCPHCATPLSNDARFCPACGIHPYAEATDPKGRLTAAVNVRCLEGIDLAAIPVKHFDGRSI